jgi:hypothetical protein
LFDTGLYVISRMGILVDEGNQGWGILVDEGYIKDGYVD